MDWEAAAVSELNFALNEATVCALRVDPSGADAELFIEVLALPPDGPIDPDPRRVIVLADFSSLEVLIRTDGPPYGPPMPMADLDDLEVFFASMTWIESMYGWDFVDSGEAPPDWPAEPSLRITTSRATGSHSIYWFADGGRHDEAEDTVRYFVEGVIHFNDLRVERADRSPMSESSFAADAGRWWDALRTHDERVSGDAQDRANRSALRWRYNGHGQFVAAT